MYTTKAQQPQVRYPSSCNQGEGASLFWACIIAFLLGLLIGGGKAKAKAKSEADANARAAARAANATITDLECRLHAQVRARNDRQAQLAAQANQHVVVNISPELLQRAQERRLEQVRESERMIEGHRVYALPEHQETLDQLTHERSRDRVR